MLHATADAGRAFHRPDETHKILEKSMALGRLTFRVWLLANSVEGVRRVQRMRWAARENAG